jgi:nickel-dependent lactate racemase
MAEPEQLSVGRESWPIAVPADRRVGLRRAAFGPPAASAADLTREALEHPHGFEAMRRALTPDDRVAVVLDPRLPEIGPVLAEVLAHLASGGVKSETVTVVTQPGDPQGWIDDLPDEFSDIRAETHDPADRKKLAYLASTAAGRRLYLNRTLVEADFVVVLTGRGYDPQTGYAGAEAAIFPALADEEARNAFAGQFETAAPTTEANAVRTEAAEVARLLGMPFLVQVIEGDGDTVQQVVAGLPDGSAEGVRRQDARWRGRVDEEPDTVIAAVSGDPGRVTFLDLAKAAACAARVVRKGGRIAVLSTAAPSLGDGARLLRSMDGPTGARKLLAKEKPADWAACYLWAFAAKNHSLFLASGYPDDVAEELFGTPIHSANEVQRLIDTGGKVLLVPDAHKAMVTAG